MPYVVNVLDQARILILDFIEPVDYQTISEAVASEVDDIKTGMDGRSDYTHIKPSYQDIIVASSSMLSDPSGGLRDKRFRPVLVFDQSFLSIAIKTLQPHFDQLAHLEFFDNLDGAIAYARRQLEAHDASS